MRSKLNPGPRTVNRTLSFERYEITLPIGRGGVGGASRVRLDS